METQEYLDFDEAVQFLKTTPSTLYKWLQAGKIPGHKLGRQWRFLRDELETHVSGKGSRLHIQKDFLHLTELLSAREKTKNKEFSMNAQAVSLSEKIIWDAFDHGSRLIHIYPAKGKYEISYRTKAGLEKLAAVQEDSFQELDSSLNKVSTALDQGGSRRLYLNRGEDDTLQVRYERLETVSGPRLTLRLWQPEKDVLPLEKITAEAEVLQTFKGWLERRSGIFIISGATGSGKTTTVYSLINEYKNRGNLVFTIEESAQLVIEGINQVEARKEQFEEVFRKVYASDPDVICLGLGSYIGIEEKAFTAAYEAASTGHVVILQLDQPDCSGALEYFKRFVRYPVENLIAGVSCQKLVAEKGRVKAVYEFYKGL